MIKYESPLLKKIRKEMEKDSWYVKFRRWLRLQLWVYRCLIFNKSKK